MSDFTLHHGDCLEVMATLEAESVDLIVADPPYFKVKDEWWDNQWDTRAGFLDWMGEVVAEFKRVLAPNGSVYIFASPQLQAHVELKVGEYFDVLNNIVWFKKEGRHKNQCVPDCRAYFPQTERIIFAEHYNSDNIALGESGYDAKCDELRGFVFEPLRAYLDGERERSGLSIRDVAVEFQKKTGSRTVTGMAGHWFTSVQWSLPTRENYQWLRGVLNTNCGEFLRKDYEELRRPFFATKDAPYTDVWEFPTVASYAGKHPCENPLSMIEHMIRISSRPDAVVLDPFMGSGVTGVASARLGRKFVGIEMDAKYFARAERKVIASYGGKWSEVQPLNEVPAMQPLKSRNGQLSLFGGEYS